MVDVLVTLGMCHFLVEIRNLELKETQKKNFKIESHKIQINKVQPCFECTDLSNSISSSGNQCACHILLNIVYLVLIFSTRLQITVVLRFCVLILFCKDILSLFDC